MKRILLGCLLSTVVAIPAVAALKAGDGAPDFKTQASLAGIDSKDTKVGTDLCWGKK